jgi:acetyl-CoA acetyltransferase
MPDCQCLFPAVRKALDRAGCELGDIERIEINEAFAAIAILVTRELGLPEDIVNVEGGAIAHGHPIGATGAVLTTRLIHSMRRDGLKRGIVTLCIGGGRHRARTRGPLIAATHRRGREDPQATVCLRNPAAG